MTFSELATYLDQLEATSSRNELVRILAEAYKACSVEEIEPITYLVRITLGKMRLGIGDPTVLDALSFAKKGDRSLRPLLEAAYNRSSDLGLMAKTLWAQGLEAIEAIKVTVGKPLRSQLAERLPNPEAVIKKLGLGGVQPKYDGFRLQIHKDGGEARSFSRNLQTITPMFPELGAATVRLPVKR